MSTVYVAIAIFALSLLGGLAPRLFSNRLSNRRLEDLTGIASGLLLASALLVVIPEGFHVAAEAASNDADEVFIQEPVVLGATVLVGFLMMLLLEGFGIGHAVHEEHHDHAQGHGHGHVHHPTSSGVLAIGLSVHAVADGLAIGAAAATGETAFSLLVGLAVLLHRVPAAFSLGLFALHEPAGWARGSRGVILFAMATPIAVIASYVLLDGGSDQTVALALLLSAGTFLYVATVDTLPAVHNIDTGMRSVLNVIAGAALFAILFLSLDAAGLLDHAH